MLHRIERWYHERQENTRQRYLEGYYPGHTRVPNFIVLGLYGIGYFIGDFVPLVLNLINGVYWAIKRLVAFIVGLLVEASIFIVLAGSVVFSVFHSIDRMRVAGAAGGLEYVGVLMFEVIFIGSAATLTGFLMKKKLPRGFIEWLGLSFTILGFFVGLAFVWWSNFQGMAPTIEGRIIGSAVPILVLIGEGILAYRFIIENKEDVTLQELIRRNQLSTDEVKAVIEQYVQKKREEAIKRKATPSIVEPKPKKEKTEKWWKKWFKRSKTKTIPEEETNDQNGSEVQEKVDAKDVETGAEINTQSGTKMDAEADVKPDGKMDVQMDTKVDTKTDGEVDVKMDTNTDTETDVKLDAQTDAKPDGNADAGVDVQVDTEADAKVDGDGEMDAQADTKMDAQVGAQMDTQVGAKTDTEADAETDVKSDAQSDAKVDGNADAEMDAQSGAKADADVDAKSDAQTDTNTGAKSGAKVDTEADGTDRAKVDADPATKTKKNSSKKGGTKKATSVKVPAKVKRWAIQYKAEKGKLPGRVEIHKKFGFGKSMSSNYAAMLKEELDNKAS